MTSLLYDFTIVSRSGNSDHSNSSNLTIKNSRGSMPRTPLGGCASGARVRLWRTFPNSLAKGPCYILTRAHKFSPRPCQQPGIDNAYVSKDDKWAEAISLILGSLSHTISKHRDGQNFSHKITPKVVTGGI